MGELELHSGDMRLNIDNKFDNDEEVYIEVEDTWEGKQLVFYADKCELEDVYNHIGALLGKNHV